MKVMQNGKEVKGAKVFYFAGGQASHVEVDGVNYDPRAFELSDDSVQAKSKPATKTAKTQSKTVAASDTADVMTTENTPTSKSKK